MAKFYKIMTKHGQLFAFLLGLLIVAIFFVNITTNVDAFEMMDEEDQAEATLFDFGLRATIILIIVNAFIALLFGIWFLIKEPKRSLKVIIGFVVLLVVLLITYNAADPGFDGPIASTLEQFDITESISRLVSAGLTTTLILGGLAALAIVAGEIYNLFKN